MNGFSLDQLDKMWDEAHRIGQMKADRAFPDNEFYAELRRDMAKQFGLEEFESMTMPHPPKRTLRKFR